MSMGEIGRLSWFFVCENIFFSLLLLFQSLYYSNAIYEVIKTSQIAGPLIEALFVFLPYLWRPLFPKTSLRDSHKSRAANTKPDNIDFYTKNTYVIKAFYNFAKHYIGFFLNYARFLGRINAWDQRMVHAVVILSTYMSTGAIFIHTLVFKKILSNKQGAMLYQAGYPFTFYLYAMMASTTIYKNGDLALIVLVGLVLNFVSLRAFHTYQALLLVAFFVWRSVCTEDPNVLLTASYLDPHLNQFNAFVEDPFGYIAQSIVFFRVSWAMTSTLQVTLAIILVLVAHKIPLVSRACDPFYPIAVASMRSKKGKHHEDDDSALHHPSVDPNHPQSLRSMFWGTPKSLKSQ